MNGSQFQPPQMPSSMPDYQGGNNQPPLDQNNGISIYNSGSPQAPQQVPGRQAGQQPQQAQQPAHGTQIPDYQTATPYTQGSVRRSRSSPPYVIDGVTQRRWTADELAVTLDRTLRPARGWAASECRWGRPASGSRELILSSCSSINVAMLPARAASPGRHCLLRAIDASGNRDRIGPVKYLAPRRPPIRTLLWRQPQTNRIASVSEVIALAELSV
ncbi:Uncharacterised protein [Mycobacteroides abscessus subsp. bolletii]|nr:Uncharacterised protein [Mycobacteroides abscessus subsp. bolletii]